MGKEVCMEMLEDNLPFFNKLGDEERELLVKHATIENFYANQIIQGNNSKPSGVLIVLKGELRVYIVSDDNKDTTVLRSRPGDIYMLSSSFVMSHVDFDWCIDSTTDSELIIIDNDCFDKIVKNNIVLENYLYRIAMSKLGDVLWTIKQILFYRLDKRLAIFLYDEYVETKNLRITYTHEQIAKYLGAARETLTRLMKYLAEEKIITLFRGGCEIIDLEKIKKLAL